MQKLTNADVQELTWWFAASPPASVAGRLVAQSYGGSVIGPYDRTTDFRLEHMVQVALSRAQSEWMRVHNVLDHVCSKPHGREVFEILRRAFGPLPADALPVKSFAFPEVAVVTTTALRRGTELATREEHVRLLEVALAASKARGGSPMTIATRVVATDMLLDRDRFPVPTWLVHATIRKMLERAMKTDDELVTAVKLEMHGLVARAGDAYRTARTELGATRREAKAARRKENERLFDDLMGRRKRKEAARFQAKLRRAS